MIKQHGLQRVAITGIGIVSPLGNDRDSTWQALMAQEKAICEIQSFDASHFPSHIAAEVKNFTLPQAIAKKKFSKYGVKFTEFALAAAAEAFADAGIEPTIKNAERWGLVVGSGMMTAEFSHWQDFHPQYAQSGEIDYAKLGREWRDFMSVTEFGKSVTNSGVALLAENFQIKGYTTAVHTACASGGQALGLALQAIRYGDADYILAGGFDSMINPIGISSFCLLGALSTYNETPDTASRPFDLTRNGFVLGEGAAFLILESWDKAIARGARIYAELAGEGNSLSSYRITDSHPSGDGAIQALSNALRDANIKPEQVDYINAHGTSTKMNDLSECNAIKAVFGEHVLRPLVSSTKGQTGHLIAAAGALEGAISALSIYHKRVPMAANLTTPDPDCPLNFVKQPQAHNVNVAVSTSFGFGGSNSCIVFKAYE